MKSEEAQARIALHVRIDVLIECLDAPDEQGVVWRDDGPYDIELPITTVLAATPIDDDDDSAWILQAALLSVAIGLLTSTVILLILAWSIYAALGVLLWLMVSAVS